MRIMRPMRDARRRVLAVLSSCGPARGAARTAARPRRYPGSVVGDDPARPYDRGENCGPRPRQEGYSQPFDTRAGRQALFIAEERHCHDLLIGGENARCRSVVKRSGEGCCNGRERVPAGAAFPLARSSGPIANNLHPRIMFAGIMTANCSDRGRRFRCPEKPGSGAGQSAESVRHDPAFVKRGSLSRHLLMRSLLMFRSGKHC